MIYAGTKNLARPVDGPAIAGESIGTTLTEQIFVERGAIATMRTFPPYELRQFKARVFWLGRKPLQRGRRYQLKLTTQQVDCEIASIERVIDASTLATISRGQEHSWVGRHEVAEREYPAGRLDSTSDSGSPNDTNPETILFPICYKLGNWHGLF